MATHDVRLSKFLSQVLRHRPQKIGLRLDVQGWAAVDALLAACNADGVALTRESLKAVVAQNDKQRFAFSPDGTRIRASQGHSVEVDLDLAPEVPPPTLFHGTVERFLAAILREGLVKGRRHHVHLSADIATAQRVGARRGDAIVLTVASARMHADGHLFLRSANGVWLTEHVPPAYLARA